MDCIELSDQRIDPEIDSILLLIFQCLFFILFLGYYYKLTYVGSLRGKGHLKQFAYSSLVSVLFSLIVWLGVSPVIRSTNQNIREIRAKNEPKRKPPFPWEEAFLLVPRARREA